MYSHMCQYLTLFQLVVSGNNTVKVFYKYDHRIMYVHVIAVIMVGLIAYRLLVQ